jgi:hypothetical protein
MGRRCTTKQILKVYKLFSGINLQYGQAMVDASRKNGIISRTYYFSVSKDLSHIEY